MLLMMAEVTKIYALRDIFQAQGLPINGFWAFLSDHQTHVQWRGLVLHDMIQPSFSFLVGIGLVYSLANRYAKGQTFFLAAIHALWRSAALVALGIFLRSQTTDSTYFTFEDTLSQIGLGYFFLFLIGHLKSFGQWVSLVTILAAYWLAFILYPAPGSQFDYSAVGVNAEFIAQHHPKDNESIAAHFNKNSNLAWAADRWILNIFPYHGNDKNKEFTHNRPDKDENWFHYNAGGYSTLNFIPTLCTMILGLIAGGWLRNNETQSRKVFVFACLGISLLATGMLLDNLDISPIVKRIWTPSWVMVSGGLSYLILAAFYFLIDIRGWRRWAFPLCVIGANSLAAYLLSDALGYSGYLHKNLVTHFGEQFFGFFGPVFYDLTLGLTILLIDWLILFWLYRNKIFIRI